MRLYFFYSNSCPHCTAARPFLQQMASVRPWLLVEAFDVGNSENEQLFTMLAREFDCVPEAVPTFVLCGEMITGFDAPEGVGAKLEALADKCHERTQAADGKPADKLERKTGKLDPPAISRFHVELLSLPVLMQIAYPDPLGNALITVALLTAALIVTAVASRLYLSRPTTYPRVTYRNCRVENQKPAVPDRSAFHRPGKTPLCRARQIYSPVPSLNFLIKYYY